MTEPIVIRQAHEWKFPIARKELIERYGIKRTDEMIAYWRRFKNVEWVSGIYEVFPCTHPVVTAYYTLSRRESRLEPAEYSGYAICNDERCGARLDLDDVPYGAVVLEGDK